MKNTVLFLSIFFIGLTASQQTQAQTVSQVYGYKLTQQHVNVYYHFMGLAKGVALTNQERAFIKQNLLNNFKMNPMYVLAEANNLILAKSNPYQSAMVVNNYRAMMQQQQQPANYYQGNPYQNNSPSYNAQDRNTRMGIINNMR